MRHSVVQMAHSKHYYCCSCVATEGLIDAICGAIKLANAVVYTLAGSLNLISCNAITRKQCARKGRFLFEMFTYVQVFSALLEAMSIYCVFMHISLPLFVCT